MIFKLGVSTCRPMHRTHNASSFSFIIASLPWIADHTHPMQFWQ